MRVIDFFREKWIARKHRLSWASRDDDSFQKYFDSSGGNRPLIRDVILNLGPKVIYEFGCYSGPNLKDYPCEVWGSDVNDKAIAFAQKRIPHGNFISTASLDCLAKWLPDKIDVSLVNAVFYTMDRDSVHAVLKMLSRKSRYLVLGDNFKNSAGTESLMVNGTFVHAWDAILRPFGAIVERFETPYQDYSTNQVVVLQFFSSADSP